MTGLASWLVRAAARRWPADLAEALRPEWEAELATLRGRRRLQFAGSLALSPAVDEAPRREQLTVAAGVTLLAAALFNGVHASGAPILLLPAAAVMAVAGSRIARPPVVLVGLALFAFLFAGNAVAVMPFMGFADIAPAVLTWVVLTTLVVRHLRSWASVAGGLIAVDLAIVAGSWHAADVLGRDPGTAFTWFPAAFRPGADDLLLANAAAMAGPMLLCSVFVIAATLHRAAPRPVAPRVGILAGFGAAVAGVGFCEWMSRSTPAPHHLLDNSFVFGFGFAIHPAGRAVVALLIALLVVQVAAPARR